MSQLQARSEAVIHAPIARVWDLITDVRQFHKINAAVVRVSGTMNQLNSTRTCDINNRGKMGTITERLVEMIPEKSTVWTIESDNMGMSKMLKETRFCFNLEKIDETKTRVVNESYYQPVNFMAKVMNALMMRKMIAKAMENILHNLKSLSEN